MPQPDQRSGPDWQQQARNDLRQRRANAMVLMVMGGVNVVLAVAQIASGQRVFARGPDVLTFLIVGGGSMLVARAVLREIGRVRTGQQLAEPVDVGDRADLESPLSQAPEISGPERGVGCMVVANLIMMLWLASGIIAQNILSPIG